MRAKIDLNLLRVLVELHTLQRVSDVARNMKISQPSVSQALNRLRQLFNDPLFVKTQGGMKPTVFASELVIPIKAALHSIDARIHTSISFNPLSTRRTITVGLSDIGAVLFLPRLAPTLQKLAPHARLQTVSPPLVGIEHGMETGDIDLVLGYRPDLKRTNYFQQKLCSSGHACLVRAGHPVLSAPVTAKKFQELEHILVRADNRAHEALEIFLTKRRIRRQIRVYTPHFMAVPPLVARSDLIVTMPSFLEKHIAAVYKNITLVTPSFPLPILPVNQYWHRRFNNDPMNRWLRQMISELFQNDSADEIVDS